MDMRPLPFQKIIFVCTNAREPGERVCCSGRGSIALHAELKEWVATQGLKRHVRVCKSGCMDRCEEGPNVMMMPDNTWLCGVDGEGLARIKAQLLEEFGAIRRGADPGRT